MLKGTIRSLLRNEAEFVERHFPGPDVTAELFMRIELDGLTFLYHTVENGINRVWRLLSRRVVAPAAWHCRDGGKAAG